MWTCRLRLPCRVWTCRVPTYSPRQRTARDEVASPVAAAAAWECRRQPARSAPRDATANCDNEGRTGGSISSRLSVGNSTALRISLVPFAHPSDSDRIAVAAAVPLGDSALTGTLRRGGDTTGARIGAVGRACPRRNAPAAAAVRAVASRACSSGSTLRTATLEGSTQAGEHRQAEQANDRQTSEQQ